MFVVYQIQCTSITTGVQVIHLISKKSIPEILLIHRKGKYIKYLLLKNHYIINRRTWGFYQHKTVRTFCKKSLINIIWWTALLDRWIYQNNKHVTPTFRVRNRIQPVEDKVYLADSQHDDLWRQEWEYLFKWNTFKEMSEELLKDQHSVVLIVFCCSAQNLTLQS